MRYINSSSTHKLFQKLVASAVLTVGLFCGGCNDFASSDAKDKRVRARNAIQDITLYESLASDVDLSEGISVDQAVKIALTHNLDMWLARQEAEIQRELTSGAYLQMLPQLTANSENNRRNKVDASTSVVLESETKGLTHSYSEERVGVKQNAALVWNILDFGVSFMRARQQRNRTRIAEYQMRRVRQRLVMEVRNAYWKAVAAQEVSGVAKSVGLLLEEQRKILARQIRKGSLSKVEGLKQELPLLNRQRILERHIQESANAMSELKKIMGLGLDSELKLRGDLAKQEKSILGNYSIEAFEKIALNSRSELFSKDKEEAISHQEARIALLQMLPSPSVMMRYDHDEDSMLKFNDWTTAALNASWSLLTIPSKVSQSRAMRSRAEYIKRERMALAVAILTQLRLTMLERESALKQLGYAQEIAHKRHALIDAMSAGERKGSVHGGQILEQKLAFLQERSAYLFAYARLMSATAKIFYTLGLDPEEEGQFIIPNDVLVPQKMPAEVEAPVVEDSAPVVESREAETPVEAPVETPPAPDAVAPLSVPESLSPASPEDGKQADAESGENDL